MTNRRAADESLFPEPDDLEVIDNALYPAPLSLRKARGTGGDAGELDSVRCSAFARIPAEPFAPRLGPQGDDDDDDGGVGGGRRASRCAADNGTSAEGVAAERECAPPLPSFLAAHRCAVWRKDVHADGSGVLGRIVTCGRRLRRVRVAVGVAWMGVLVGGAAAMLGVAVLGPRGG